MRSYFCALSLSPSEPSIPAGTYINVLYTTCAWAALTRFPDNALMTYKQFFVAWDGNTLVVTPTTPLLCS